MICKIYHKANFNTLNILYANVQLVGSAHVPYLMTDSIYKYICMHCNITIIYLIFNDRLTLEISVKTPVGT